MSRQILGKLDPMTVLHPDDRTIVENLNKIWGFKSLLEKTVGNYRGAFADVTYSGDGYAITPKSNPSLYNQLLEDCKILGLKEIPKLSSEWMYFIAAFSIGGENQRIVLTSGAIDLLTPSELDFILGHEIGHIRCGHKPYQMLLESLYMPLLNDATLKMYSALIKLPLLEWYRTCNYTADRMGLLCCQDIEVALKTMVKMSGLPKKCYPYIDTKAFLQQAEEFEQKHTDTMDKIVKILSIRSAESPWLVLRAGKLMEWYQSGEYNRIINNNRISRW